MNCLRCGEHMEDSLFFDSGILHVVYECSNCGYKEKIECRNIKEYRENYGNYE